MSQRERILMMAVGGLIFAVVANWGISSYRDASKKRKSKLEKSTAKIAAMREQQITGEQAYWQMGEYTARSLPSDRKLAEQTYSQWLLQAVKDSGIKSNDVSPINSRISTELYSQLSYRVEGSSDVPSFVKFLHDFNAKDWLHRIRSWSLMPDRSGDFRISMTIDAIALRDGPDSVPTETEDDGETKPSYRLNNDLASYEDKILNRNLFQPPNLPPRFTGESEISAVEGKKSTTTLTFKDPESHPISFELVKAPEGVEASLDSKTGTLRVAGTDVGEFPIEVRAVDGGLPKQTTELTLTYVVAKAPPPKEPEPEPEPFDETRSTTLIGMVDGRMGAKAFLKILTRDKTLTLKPGDSFDIGKVSGVVEAIESDYVAFIVDQTRYKIFPDQRLRNAMDAGGEALPQPSKDAEANAKDVTTSDSKPAEEKAVASNSPSMDASKTTSSMADTVDADTEQSDSVKSEAAAEKPETAAEKSEVTTEAAEPDSSRSLGERTE